MLPLQKQQEIENRLLDNGEAPEQCQEERQSRPESPNNLKRKRRSSTRSKSPVKKPKTTLLEIDKEKSIVLNFEGMVYSNWNSEQTFGVYTPGTSELSKFVINLQQKIYCHIYWNNLSQLFIGTIYWHNLSELFIGTIYRNNLSQLFIGTIYRNNLLEIYQNFLSL
jgi:hypothetical protein